MALRIPRWQGVTPDDVGTVTEEYDARDDRQVLDAIAFSEGVVRHNDFKVVPRGAGANLSVDILGGLAFITGDASSRQGKYLLENDATDNVATGFAIPGSGSTVFEVWAQINDKQAGTSTTYSPTWVVQVAGSPGLPNAIFIARVTLSKGDSSIQAANIVDVRAFAKPLGYGTLRQDLVFSGVTDGQGYMDLPHTLGRVPQGFTALIIRQVAVQGSFSTGLGGAIDSSTGTHVRVRAWRAIPFYVQPGASMTIAYSVW